MYALACLLACLPVCWILRLLNKYVHNTQSRSDQSRTRYASKVQKVSQVFQLRPECCLLFAVCTRSPNFLFYAYAPTLTQYHPSMKKVQLFPLHLITTELRLKLYLCCTNRTTKISTRSSNSRTGEGEVVAAATAASEKRWWLKDVFQCEKDTNWSSIQYAIHPTMYYILSMPVRCVCIGCGFCERVWLFATPEMLSHRISCVRVIIETQMKLNGGKRERERTREWSRTEKEMEMEMPP